MFEKFLKNRFIRLQMKYDEEIREKCDHYHLYVNDCLKRLENENECSFYIKKFDKCVKDFDKQFRDYYNLK